MKELKEKYKGNEVYEKRMKKIEQLTQDEEFMGYYDLEEKHKWQINDAYKTGYLYGLKLSFEQTIHQNKINMAKWMLEEKMDIEDVIYVTGLKIEEITNLQ